MRRVESMLLAVQLKNMINYPVQASKVSSQLKVVSF
jgi:endoribonuclease Dicer